MDGCLYVVSVSGGKDSTATCLHLRELGIPHRRVFADTGWELPETYTYIREVLEPALGPIDWVRGPRQMEELIRHKGMFPSRRRRFCTEQLKFLPIKRYLHALADAEGCDVVNVIGIRAEESKARAQLPEREHDDGMDLEVWRAIIGWSLQDVIDIHARHNIPPNPLYLKGFTRVGCAPCIMARKKEIMRINQCYPQQIDRIRVLEYALRDRLGSTGTAPYFFQAKLPEVSIGPGGEKVETYPAWPIDLVVAWSKTPHGGRETGQLEMFAPGPGQDGCMQWGLCDTEGGPAWVVLQDEEASDG